MTAKSKLALTLPLPHSQNLTDLRQAILPLTMMSIILGFVLCQVAR